MLIWFASMSSTQSNLRNGKTQCATLMRRRSVSEAKCSTSERVCFIAKVKTKNTLQAQQLIWMLNKIENTKDNANQISVQFD